ncbi:MAG: tetratricopeptide repeat protein, partial [Desulfobacterales bacterium]|nr:tetratricopeptide repeat protein [Desulfobacterales bacterium]
MLEMGIGILIQVLLLIGFILFVIVLIKQFKHGGALQGILGIITCGLWTFIWGWIKCRSLAMTKLMIIWTVIEVAPLVLVGVFGAAMMGQMYKLVSEFTGDPALLLQQDQKQVATPGFKKRGAPINLAKRRAKNAPAGKNADWNAKAMALWKDGKYTDPNKAKSYWDRAIAGSPKVAETYNNRGLAFYNLKLYQEAIKDFSQSIRMKPGYAEAFNNRGNAYYELDQYEKARADFDQSIKIKPKYSKAHMNRGLVYFQMEAIDQ